MEGHAWFGGGKLMITKTNFFMPFVLSPLGSVSFCSLVLLMVFVGSSVGEGAEAPKSKASAQSSFRIEVQDEHGIPIADSGKDSQSLSRTSAVLAFEHEYQPGDRIIVSGPSRMAVRVDDWIPECLIYLANPARATFSFDIPYGQGEPATRSPFSQDSFAGKWHRITARTLTDQELSGYRNLAVNACDRELQPPAVEGTAAQQPVFVFPHASTNSVSRSLPDFRARNAIDGMTQNGHHGVWPYQSWGPELRNDLWWKIDFGRLVEVDKIRLMVRADFPHDSYWESAVVEFSDGEQVPIRISQSAEFQEFIFPKRNVSWVKLNKLMPADPARWCSFIEIETWGWDRK
jgi:hypothetical protein